jgi:cysteine sulfinate desulfinase/cysteine desulfurase-like protein/glyoxylase-like metal-dependent hydrolase (beta-lactamase superfamily II)/rhodanese-related sulfurtransferase
VQRRVDLAPAGEIYLDANATTRVLPQAAQAAQDAMEKLYGNPSSSHITGLRARHILESARALATAVLGASKGRIVFTSGATEAIQMAVFSALVAASARDGGASDGAGRALLFGATEHKAVPEALKHWRDVLGLKHELAAIPADRRGLLDFRFLEARLPRADIVCTMAVNNETGVIHDLAALEGAIRGLRPDVPWLVDCVQALAKVPLDLSSTTIDYAAISGHKLYAPKGIGLLYVRRGAPLTPLIAGGGQESGARSGTENLPGVAALGAVFRCLADPEDRTFQSDAVLRGFRDRLAASLREALPGIVFNTPFEHAVPTTINFSVKGFSSKELLDLFDAAGVRVSSGSACGSALKGSYVLEAMGFPPWRSEGAIRLSFGPAATAAEIDAACERIEEAGKALRCSCLIVADDLEEDAAERRVGLMQLKRGSICSWILVGADGRRAVIIDPIAELVERIEAFVRCQGLEVIAVLDTHLHVDHASCRTLLIELLGERVAAGARTRDLLGWPEPADGEAALGDGSRAECLRLSDGEVLARTDLPGHTADGRAYLFGGLSGGGALPPEAVRFAFTGDTVLIGGLGRTDFPTSSAAEFFQSLHKLRRLAADRTIFCPTHDYTNDFATTLAAERRHDRLLAAVLDPAAPLALEAFELEKARVDGGIDDRKNTELVCGLIHRPVDPRSSIDVRPDELQSFFAKHRASLVVDVREPHEYRLFRDWASLGLETPPENVPLTRFSDFLARLLFDGGARAERDVIFVCRSGSRSSRAAEVLRRLGFDRAWHIAGGIALGARAGAAAGAAT